MPAKMPARAAQRRAAKPKAAKQAVANKPVAKKAVAKQAVAKKAVRSAPKVKPANLKTLVNDASVPKFLSSVTDADQRREVDVLAQLFGAVTTLPPRMWGGSIVGYGSYAYVGKSGRAGDWFLAGFSPRKGTLSLYMLGGWEADKALLAKLGKHTLGKGCLYVKRLSDVDPKVLKALVSDAFKRAKAIAPKMANGGNI